VAEGHGFEGYGSVGSGDGFVRVYGGDCGESQSTNKLGR